MDDTKDYCQARIGEWLRSDERVEYYENKRARARIIRTVAPRETTVVDGTLEFVVDWQYGTRLEIINSKLTVLLQRTATIGQDLDTLVHHGVT